MVRRSGTLDPLYLRGRSRDVYTDTEGNPHVLGECEMQATVEMVAGRIAHLDTTPCYPKLRELVGGPARSGFRSAVNRVDPALRQRRDRAYTLLDDLPAAVLISGHALSAAGLLGDTSQAGYMPVANQCAGFITGGLLMNSFEAGQITIPTGPIAPALDCDDAQGWHAMEQLSIHGMRRRRRLDAWRDAAAASRGETLVDAMFRDSYVRSDNSETVIHEYTVNAHIAADGTIRDVAPVPRVLPWLECPGAVAAARRVEGMNLTELHQRVRHEMVGTSTCTHLNDLLRSLADVSALRAVLNDQEG